MTANKDLPDTEIQGLPLTSRGLHIYQHNICSLYSKLDELKYVINNSVSKVDIYGLTETHLSSNVSDNMLLIPGYSFYRRDRVQYGRGGVAAYISNQLRVKRRSDLESPEVESLWLEVEQINSLPLLVSVVYRVPNALVDWYDHFENELSNALKKNCYAILICDINIDMLSTENNRRKNLFDSYGFTQLIKEPTRVTDKTATLLDHILVSHTDFVQLPVYHQ